MNVLQMRLVVVTEDFDEAVAFYRDTMGLDVEFSGEEDGQRVLALQAGRATLEIMDPVERRHVDQIEVGRDVSRTFRVAFEVTDVDGDTDRLRDAGAELLAPPTETPWRSRNSRLEAPAGIQLTLFEELDEQP